MGEAEQGIFVNYRVDKRRDGTYQLYSCFCKPEEFAPYEQIILHLKLEHHITLQEAEVVVHYAKHPIAYPENWMR